MHKNKEKTYQSLPIIGLAARVDIPTWLSYMYGHSGCLSCALWQTATRFMREERGAV